MDCQYIGVCGGSPVSDSLSQSIVAGAISGERLSILHPGDSGGWRHSRHTCQCTTLLLVGQVCDDGSGCGRREDDITSKTTHRVYSSQLNPLGYSPTLMTT